MRRAAQSNRVTFILSNDESLTSCSEFVVMKSSVRSDDPVKRVFCLSEACVVERDPLTYKPVTCKPLCDVSFVPPSMLVVAHAR